MTQEDKELLLKDLCTRLPYGVIVETQIVNAPRAKYPVLKVLQSHMLCDFMQTIENVIHKPYLFPLSSMTYKQIHEFNQILGKDCDVSDGHINIIDSRRRTFSYQELDALLQFLNKNHFDYRGLIEKGLAIDATNLKIY